MISARKVHAVLPVLPVLPVLLVLVAQQAWAQAAPGAGNTLAFGGKAVPIDSTSCSADNSSNGKNRAIAAIHSATSSSATVQFATPTPATGTYTTVDDEDALAAGKVIVGAAGSAFGGAYLAKPGQTVAVTKTGARYQAVFADLAVLDMQSKAASGKKLTGNVACQ